MQRRRFLWVVVLTATGCGGNGTNHESTTLDSNSTLGNETDLSADLASIAVAEPGRPQRPEPNIATLDDAERALAAGFYSPVESALPRLATDADASRAALLRARLEFETGRYVQAEASARSAAARPEQRIAGETLRGEALLATGQLDEAESVLSAVAGESAAHRARIMLGRLFDQRGRTSEAEQQYRSLIDAYNDETIAANNAEGLTYVAMAARGLGSYHDANDAFQEATRADPARVETQVEWARIFYEKFDMAHAAESLEQALEHNPNSADAHALFARIYFEQVHDFSKARESAHRALEINPNHVLANVVVAGLALFELDTEAAELRLDHALAVNPNDLTALSVRAASRFLADDAAGFATAKQEVFQRNRRFGDLYNIIAIFAEWEHRYPDIVNMARDAVIIDPENADAHALLGMNLLRMGDETNGLRELQEAWRRDRFNVRVYNTLQLYEDVIPAEYEEFEARPFVFRMHRSERGLLARYVPPTLSLAYRSMVSRYGFEPEGPLRFELFASNEHFSVRTLGLPNLGVQGVCFGNVVTAISPHGGPFNWAQITWHELAHVFHIQLSRNRVPRWFTEGLAEYEAVIARGEWRREMDHILYDALEHRTLPELRFMNRAFTHADSTEQMVVAYYASTQIVTYIVERFGFDAVVRMLRLWSESHRTPEVVQTALGISIDELDDDFRTHVAAQLNSYGDLFRPDFSRYQGQLEARQGAAARAPTNATAQAEVAAALLVAGNTPEAVTAANRALAIDATEPLANYILGRLALEERNIDLAESHLRRILSGGSDSYEPRLLLARIAAHRNDMATARAELEVATNLMPAREEAWAQLAQLAERTHDAELQIRALSRIVDLDEHGRAALAQLLSLLAAHQRWTDVVAFGARVPFANPFDSASHFLYATGLLETGNAEAALFEFDSALLAHPESIGEVQLGRARALVALRRFREAREAANAAVVADPNLRAAADEILGP